jgi:hypothetical protein
MIRESRRARIGSKQQTQSRGGRMMKRWKCGKTGCDLKITIDFFVKRPKNALTALLISAKSSKIIATEENEGQLNRVVFLPFLLF